MTVTVHYLNSDTETYDEIAKWHEDGTVEGTSSAATRLRFVVTDILEPRGEDPADWYEDIKSRLQARYSTGFYRVTWDG